MDGENLAKLEAKRQTETNIISSRNLRDEFGEVGTIS